jgi:HEPN domain-containing protein
MEIDPQEEVIYRLNTAIEQLEAATKRLSIEDWVGTVQASQLTAENAAKAVIAHFHLPGWTHDPSNELREILNKIPNHLKDDVGKLIDIVSTLAPEHGRTSYGIPTERITPRQLYNRENAEEALRKAREAYEISRKILKHLGYKL